MAKAFMSTRQDSSFAPGIAGHNARLRTLTGPYQQTVSELIALSTGEVQRILAESEKGTLCVDARPVRLGDCYRYTFCQECYSACQLCDTGARADGTYVCSFCLHFDPRENRTYPAAIRNTRPVLALAESLAAFVEGDSK